MMPVTRNNMQKTKKKYRVIFGAYGEDADGCIPYDSKNIWECETLAVSARKAINNARFRMGQDSSLDVYGEHDQGQGNWYEVYVSEVQEEAWKNGKVEWVKVYPVIGNENQ